MNVSLTPRLEAMVREKVASGRYNNSSEVVREALRLLEERETLNNLRSAIQVGLDEIATGAGVPYSPAVLAEIDRDADELIRRAEPVDSDVRP